MKSYKEEVDSVLSFLSSRIDGLNNSQVEHKRAEFGFNVLPEEKQKSLLMRFLDQFKDFLIILLLIAGLISIFMKSYSDAIIILVIVVLNAIVSLVQEYKAEKSLEVLKNMMVPLCYVIRDGKEQQIKAKDLVPGDVIVLEEGSKVPADARIIESSELKVEESALTGESVPVSKDSYIIEADNLTLTEQRNMVFMGTSVTSGRCKAVVTSIGKDTEIGKIAKITQQIQEEDSPLKIELNKVGKFVAWFALFVCIAIFVCGIFGIIKVPGIETMQLIDKIWFFFKYVISVAVAIVPEGLAATVTISLALGVRQMAKEKAIIRRLPAVETLGCTTVICSDKTGTLTKNQMTAVKLFVNGKDIFVSGAGYNPQGEFWQEQYSKKQMVQSQQNPNKIPLDKNDQLMVDSLLKAAALCNNAKLMPPDTDHKDWYILGDPTEGALITCAEKNNISLKHIESEEKRILELAFDSNRKMMTTVHEAQGVKKAANASFVAYVKGAPDIILDRCDSILLDGKTKKLTLPIKKKLLQQNNSYGEQALRVLAIAMHSLTKKQISDKKGIEENLTFIGFIGMIDPVRDGVKESVALCKKAGIKVVIITGDSGVTAGVIAKELDIMGENGRVVTGSELNDMNDETLKKVLSGEVIFARVTPEHKMRIVHVLQEMGERVAVTGDGVNDAPALKKAEIGIAMGIAGTDVAKESSDMILTDDSFATIVSAIKRGRGIYENIKKVVLYVFTGIASELFVVMFAIFAAIPLPITAVQILWIDLGSEVMPGLALGADGVNDDVMNKKPRSAKERMMNKKMLSKIARNALFISAVVILIFLYYYSFGDTVKASTMAFLTIIFMQMANTFNARDDEKSIFSIGFFSNKAVWFAIITSLALTVLMVQVPYLQGFLGVTNIALIEWAVLVGCSILMILYVEIIKWLKRRRKVRLLNV